MSHEVRIEWVKAMLTEWQDFWPAPATLTPNNADRWLQRYHEALIKSRLVARYWPEICKRVYLHCRFFPMPADLEEIAKAVWREKTP